MQKNTKQKDNKTSGKFAIVGKWFHSFDNGKLIYQGQVLDYDVYSQLCLVQLYDWMVGAPHGQKLFSINDMKEWVFYNTDEEMRDFYEIYYRHRIENK